MLYLDYSRKARRVDPQPATAAARTSRPSTSCGGFNEAVYEHYPDVQTIAEESTAWPMVSRPTYVGGLGFGLKWDMGWMHDTLRVHVARTRSTASYHHNELTFRMLYAFTENFILPLSHDEVVHGKGSLLGKMPGDDWQKFANLRAALRLHVRASRARSCSSWAASSAQWREWNHEREPGLAPARSTPPHAGHAALGRAT